jgi:glycosyltransferase involved in cell wall biosynthesis
VIYSILQQKILESTSNKEMAKKTIIIVIDNFARGGAETLLVGILPELNQCYNVVLVTLTDYCDFRDDEIISSQKYTLGFTNKFAMIKCVQKLKRIIRRHNPSIVHAHLVFSSLIARIACPSSIPLVYTLHNTLSKDIFDKSRILTFLEKNSIKKKHSIIAVSSEVLMDYKKTVKKIKNSFVLDNYIADPFINQKITYKEYSHFNQLKLVAVGNIKVTKNYRYLIKAFTHLKQYPVTLDIYGHDQGNLLELLQKEVAIYQLPIIFKGKAINVHELLVNYDAYVLPSMFEGFGIAAVEAMAVGLPLLLSDLTVLRTVTMNNALFFDVNHPMTFVILIKEIFEDKYDLNMLSEKGIKIARNNYAKEAHIKKLFSIYDEIQLLNNVK